MEKLILECVVRSVLIAASTALALYLLRVRAARVRHAVWAGVVVLMLALPLWTAWGPKAVLRVLTPPPVVTAEQSVVTMVQSDAVSSPMNVPRKSWGAGDYLLGIYLLGLGILLTRLATGTVRALTLVRRADGLDGRLTSEACTSPITVGAFRPVVILPEGWTEWPESQLNAVMAHEREHANRRDPLVQWLAMFNRAVFWFHPLSWWLSRRLSALAEEACDDAVLAGGHDPEEYTECLLGLARSVRESGARVSAVGMAMPGAYLPQRIRRIVAGAPAQTISRGRMISVAVLCAAVSTVFSVCAIGYANEAAPPVRNVAVVETASPVAIPTPAAPVVRQKSKRMELAQNTPAPQAAAGPQTLSGVVIDPAGAVVPNAPVTLVNTDTKASVSANTDPVGRYIFQNIDAGTYNLTVNAPGFKRVVQNNIRVSAGEAHNASTMPLQLGDVSESVSVVGSRSAQVTPTAAVGNSLGDATALAPKALPPIGIPLDQTVGRTFRYTVGRNAEDSAGARPIKVGGNVVAANLIAVAKPVYPAELQRAGVQGTVKLEALISKDGLASDIHLINSPDPGLTQAALDAVKQWRYRPTQLNGESVEVKTSIDVNFSLSD